MKIDYITGYFVDNYTMWYDRNFTKNLYRIFYIF